MTLFKNIFRNRFTSKANFFTVTVSHILLKLKSNFGLFLFNNKIWKKFLNYSFSFCMRTIKAVSRSMVNWFIFLERNIAIKSFFKNLNRSNIRHSDKNFQFIGRRFGTRVLPTLFSSCYANTSFSVKKTCEIFNRGFHSIFSFCRKYTIDTQQSQVEFLNKQANSVELPMPNGNGQYRAKLGESRGVCNEQVLAPKGMVCSDLYGNIESATEMLAPAV